MYKYRYHYFEMNIFYYGSRHANRGHDDKNGKHLVLASHDSFKEMPYWIVVSGLMAVKNKDFSCFNKPYCLLIAVRQGTNSRSDTRGSELVAFTGTRTIQKKNLESFEKQDLSFCRL